MYRYRIGSLQFCWIDCGFPLVQDEFMAAYEVEERMWSSKCETVFYKSRFLDLDKYQFHPLLKKNETYEMYDTDKGILLIYHWAKCRFGFGYWLNDLKRGNQVLCYFHPDMKDQIPLSAVRFFSCAGMHSKLLQHGDMILHAAYIAWEGKAILFTAPSGTGKSTQADLWCRYAGAELINGDRALVGKKEGRWYSHGYPCCGSSSICLNRSLPIAAIIILEQGNANEIMQLSKAEKIRSLVSGTEVYPWDREEIDYAFELSESLAQSVPIFKLICCPDKGAVDVVRQKWKEILYDTSI